MNNKKITGIIFLASTFCLMGGIAHGGMTVSADSAVAVTNSVTVDTKPLDLSKYIYQISISPVIVKDATSPSQVLTVTVENGTIEQDNHSTDVTIKSSSEAKIVTPDASLSNLAIKSVDITKPIKVTVKYDVAAIKANTSSDVIESTGTITKVIDIENQTNPSQSSSNGTPTTSSESSSHVKPVNPGKPVKTKVIYRLYNPNTGEHFYPTSAYERNKDIAKGWRNEGTLEVAPTSGKAIYRMYNPNAQGGDHYYTMSKYEASKLVQKGWKWDNNKKPVFYSGGKKPVYVAYNSHAKTGAHNYTMSKYEQNSILHKGWKFGATAWYAVK